GGDAATATSAAADALQAAADAIARYGGRVDQATSNQLVGVFGLPTSHEDDPVRAVRAARAAASALSRLIAQRHPAIALSLHAGADTGNVLVSPGADYQRRFVGDPARVATELATIAGENET